MDVRQISTMSDKSFGDWKISRMKRMISDITTIMLIFYFLAYKFTSHFSKITTSLVKICCSSSIINKSGNFINGRKFKLDPYHYVTYCS